MKAFYHPSEKLHHPKTRFARGKLLAPTEVPARLEPLLFAARQLGFEVLTPQDYGRAPIEAVHTPEYVRFLETAYERWKAMPDWGEEVIPYVFVRAPHSGSKTLKSFTAEVSYYIADGCAPLGEGSWESIYAAAQSAIAAAHAVLEGERLAYAISRPPGHHARADSAGGYCYLNNTAIAAQALREKFGRVAIIDTDMHHGNGVQEIFYERDDVLYVSIHGDPTDFYPVVEGFSDETGRGRGEGFNLNLPMPHGAPESVFFAQVDKALAAIRAFRPDALVHALGFDVYEKDPQSVVSVSTPGFSRLGNLLANLALPTVVVQEGGYAVDGLAENLAAYFSGFCASRN
jgi:acetoin utilization deacetylase AcuC-like enzyme